MAYRLNFCGQGFGPTLDAENFFHRHYCDKTISRRAGVGGFENGPNYGVNFVLRCKDFNSCFLGKAVSGEKLLIFPIALNLAHGNAPNA